MYIVIQDGPRNRTELLSLLVFFLFFLSFLYQDTIFSSDKDILSQVYYSIIPFNYRLTGILRANSFFQPVKRELQGCRIEECIEGDLEDLFIFQKEIKSCRLVKKIDPSRSLLVKSIHSRF